MQLAGLKIKKINANFDRLCVDFFNCKITLGKESNLD